MRQRANRLAANLKARLSQQANGRYRFITLTLKHTTKPLKQQIRRLYRCFKHLRHSKIWKASQSGGAHILEVKWDSKSKQWHPHLHCISEGEFIHHADLSAAWLKITGDSFIVDIRSLKDGNDAAAYVAKYVGKGVNTEVWSSTTHSVEWLLATKGLRICATWGKWRGFRLMKANNAHTDWKEVCTLDKLVAAFRNGEEWSKAVYMSLRPPGNSDEVLPIVFRSQ
jgi:hypothetical protein